MNQNVPLKVLSHLPTSIVSITVLVTNFSVPFKILGFLFNDPFFVVYMLENQQKCRICLFIHYTVLIHYGLIFITDDSLGKFIY